MIIVKLIKNLYGNIINYFKRYFIPVVIHNKTPVIIFNGGRCGSSEMYRTLKHYNIPVFLLHEVYKYRNSYGFWNRYLFFPTRVFLSSVLVGYLKKGHPAKVLHFMRDKTERNISSFFASYSRFYDYFKGCTDKEILELFIDRFNHNSLENWYDQEYKIMRDFNVIFYSNNLNELNLNAIGVFVGVPDLKLVSAPVGVKHKEYGDRYKQFINGEVWNNYKLKT